MAPPEQPVMPVLPAVGRFDGRTLARLAADTSQRAHSLLRTLTKDDAAATTQPMGILMQADRDTGSPVPLQLPHIPLQQRLREDQEATGMSKAELAQAVREWDLNG
ncbi:hypothetical protein [Streptomyces sp. NPDC059003]|uniref:hypothetical protein n=1 Tax=Streptomyces sp. NPDC059003 TaxID=3346691 RepID=UPI0036ACF2DB